MRAARTQKQKTRATPRWSRLSVTGKEPGYDYCFRRRKDIDENGGMDQHGWEPIGVANHKGEELGVPDRVKKHMAKGGGRKQIIYEDVILCKRPVEVTAFFKEQEDERYNAQVNLIKNAATSARGKLRERMVEGGFDADSADITGTVETKLTQRLGPSIENEEK